MLHSDNIPNVPKNIGTAEMTDLFRNFQINWDTLSPVLWLLLGVLFAFYVAYRIKETMID